MKINRNYFAAAILGIVAVFALNVSIAAAPKGKGKQKHNNGQQLVGAKIKTNGRHAIDKKGEFTASVDVQNGKIAGLHVNHPKKGEVAVKKYKTNKKMAQGVQSPYRNAAFVLVQDQYLGTTYIGYAYIDDYGYEEIYWFPYDMILDGDTGAVLYEPAY